MASMHGARLGSTLSAVLCILAGCTGATPQAGPLDPPKAAAEAIALYDKSKNGSLEAAELSASPALKNALDKYDADKNGSVTQQEIQNRVQYYSERLGNLTMVFAMVTLDGAPLEGAAVTLVPEPWLGRPTVTNQTDAKGEVVFRMENAEEAGVHAGLYKIEVSKKDDSGSETVPGKYNTNTTLGQEAAPDRRELESPIKLALTK
jgi:hypothetical protein